MTLSICIPTYNRKDMLLELLDSIAEQLSDSLGCLVEIAISDNASEDGTSDAVTDYIKKHPALRIIYSRNETNIGPDLNYIKAVEISSGDYSWIVGSDDKIGDEALPFVINQINEGYDLYLSNRQNYSIDFKNDLGIQFFFKKELQEDKIIHIYNEDDWSKYFNLCTELGGVCSYLSSFFFKREMFIKAKGYEPFIGSAYVHVYMIFKGMIESNEPTIKIIKQPIIKCRMGNDSFLVNGYQRIMLDFKGYYLLSSLFVNPVSKRDFLEILMKQHPFIPIETILRMNKQQCDELKSILKAIGYSEQYIELIRRMNSHKLITCIMYLDRIVSKVTKRQR